VISLDAPRQHQQVAALGIGDTVLRGAQPQRQLGAVDRPQPLPRVLGGLLGESWSTVEAVVIGERQPLQTQGDRLLDEVVGTARAVEKAEVAVAVQLGIGHDRPRRTVDLLGIGLGSLA
jgi:hypothetical protein